MRDLEGRRQGRLANLAVGVPGIGRIILAVERAEQLAEPDRIDAGDLLVEGPWIELRPELPGLAARDEPLQPIPGNSEERESLREQVFDHGRQRERGILEAEPDQLRILVQERDDFLRLGRQAAAARGDEVKVRQHQHAPFDRPAHGVTELGEHRAEEALRHARRLVAPRPAVEIEMTRNSACLSRPRRLTKTRGEPFAFDEDGEVAAAATPPPPARRRRRSRRHRTGSSIPAGVPTRGRRPTCRALNGWLA